MVTVRRLRWDPWNVGHIARHDVVPEEVEEVCLGRPSIEAGYMGRLRLVGPTLAGRILAVILAPEEEEVYHVITARPASRKERQRYGGPVEGTEE
jgi:uncharacterized DUF497 family protein